MSDDARSISSSYIVTVPSEWVTKEAYSASDLSNGEENSPKPKISPFNYPLDKISEMVTSIQHFRSVEKK